MVKCLSCEILKPEITENQKICSACAAIRIQAKWKGYITRKNDPSAIEYKRICETRKNRLAGRIWPLANDASYTDDHQIKGTYASKMVAILEELNQNIREKPGREEIGVIIGNGYIFSLIGKIDINEFWICDIDPVVFIFFKMLKHTILELATKIPKNCSEAAWEDFCKDFYLRLKQLIIRYRYEKQIVEDFIKGLISEQDRLNSLHFLYSPENFLACREALQQKTIITKIVNFFDKDHVNMLAQDLKTQNKSIRYLYLTNLYDYEDPIRHERRPFLRILPISPYCCVIWTRIKGGCKHVNMPLMHSPLLPNSLQYFLDEPDRDKAVPDICRWLY